MATTETKEAPQIIEGEILSEVPPTEGKKIELWKSFEMGLEERATDFANILPRHISKEKFISTTVAAVKQNPDLLTADARTLFAAVTKAAQDGLMPDGREGVITVYNTKVKRNGKEEWIKAAQWNPMTYGLRKRAKETDDIIIDAQVVHANDTEGQGIIWEQGDEPHIIHRPAKLGTARGDMIGAYAIFKKDGVILHREVMDKDQIETTRNQSKAKDSLMWTTFKSEGYRKAVIRRGMKTVPVSSDLERIITRDDENFEFNNREPAPVAPSAPPAPIVPSAPAPAITSDPPAPSAPAPAAPSAAAPAAPQAPAAEAPKPEAPKTDAPKEPAADAPKGGKGGKVKVDETTGEILEDKEPHLIPLQTTRGRAVWVPWGKILIDYILAAQSAAEIDQWRKLNAEYLGRCEKEAEKAFKSINKAIAQRAGELAVAKPVAPVETAPSATVAALGPSIPPADVEAEDPHGGDSDEEYQDFCRDAFAELDQCTNELAVDEIRERLLPQMRDEDKGKWKESCADKSTQLFNRGP